MIRVLTLAALLSTGPAFAQICTFTTECFDGDGCSETSFQAEIATDDGGTTSLVTDAATIALSAGGSDETKVYVGVTQSGFHLLTVAQESGEARYSNHIYSGPLMVNYLGVCQ